MYVIKNNKIPQSVKDDIKDIISANDNRYKSFYQKYLDIESELYNINFTEKVIYNFKNTSPCKFIIERQNGHLAMSLISNNLSIKLGSEKTVNEIMTLCDKIDEEIENRRLFFSPEPDKEFIKDILSVKRGDILSYNNRNAFVCINDEPGNIILKYAFHGDIKNIKIGDFENSETFHITDEKCNDLNYVYSLAYDYKSVSVTRRKYDFELGNGYYPITEIEEKHKQGTVTECNIGNCKLRLIDKDKKYYWYDSNGKEISRDTIALLFAWTKTVAADVNIINEFWHPNNEIDKKDIQDINNIILENKPEILIDKLFKYAENNNNYSSISFEGLFQNNLDFIPVTFAFSMQNEKQCVYKLEYNGNEHYNIQESSINEFLEFYKQRYENVKNITLTQFKNYTEKEQDIIFNEIIKKSSNKNILGRVSSTEENEIHNIVKSYMDDLGNNKKYSPIQDIIPIKYNSKVSFGQQHNQEEKMDNEEEEEHNYEDY